MFGRPISTVLPSHTTNRVIDKYQDHMKRNVDRAKQYGDQHTKPLAPLMAGQPVRVLNRETKTWFPATVVFQNRDRSYSIRTESGSFTRRNRRQLREMAQPLKPRPSEGSGVIPDPPAPNLDKNTTTKEESYVPPQPSMSPSTKQSTSAPPLTSQISPSPARTPEMVKTRSGRCIRPPLRLRE